MHTSQQHIGWHLAFGGPSMAATQRQAATLTQPTGGLQLVVLVCWVHRRSIPRCRHMMKHAGRRDVKVRLAQVSLVSKVHPVQAGLSGAHWNLSLLLSSLQSEAMGAPAWGQDQGPAQGLTSRGRMHGLHGCPCQAWACRAALGSTPAATNSKPWVLSLRAVHLGQEGEGRGRQVVQQPACKGKHRWQAGSGRVTCSARV